MDIYTEKQKARMVFDQQLAKAYKVLKSEHPKASPTRLMSAMAESGLYKYRSAEGIKNALKRCNAL